jgi:hypothetical protein
MAVLSKQWLKNATPLVNLQLIHKKPGRVSFTCTTFGYRSVVFGYHLNIACYLTIGSQQVSNYLLQVLRKRLQIANKGE